MALIVYGIMRAPDARRAADADVELVEHGDVAVLARRVRDDELRLRRETILSHADVLQAAVKHGPVLPLRLGTAIADEEAVVRELLAPQAEALARRLDALDGKAEMQVKATYSEGPLLRSILDSDRTLRRAVERNRGLPAAAAHFEQMRVGEAIANAVQRRRAADADALLDALRPLAIAVSLGALHHERAVLNAAFLIESDELGGFDSAVERLSEASAGEVEFKLIGPLPAYSFAEAQWEALGNSRTPA